MERNVFVDAMEFVRNYFRRTQKELQVFKDEEASQSIRVYVESVKQDTNLEMIEGLADIEKIAKDFKTNSYMLHYMNTLGFQLVCYLSKDWLSLCKTMAMAVVCAYKLEKHIEENLVEIFRTHPWLVCVLIIRATDFADNNENKELMTWKLKES